MPNFLQFQKICPKSTEDYHQEIKLSFSPWAKCAVPIACTILLDFDGTFLPSSGWGCHFLEYTCFQGTAPFSRRPRCNFNFWCIIHQNLLSTHPCTQQGRFSLLPFFYLLLDLLSLMSYSFCDLFHPKNCAGNWPKPGGVCNSKWLPVPPIHCHRCRCRGCDRGVIEVFRDHGANPHLVNGKGKAGVLHTHRVLLWRLRRRESSKGGQSGFFVGWGEPPIFSLLQGFETIEGHEFLNLKF